MSAIRTRSSLLKSLHDYRYILIPALVFTIELTVWAALNLKGLGNKNWVYWRVFLLLSVFLVAWSGSAFNKNDEWFFMCGSLIPWGGMTIAATVYGFIQMSLNFLTLDLFFVGVLGSFALQLFFTALACKGR